MGIISSIAFSAEKSNNSATTPKNEYGLVLAQISTCNYSGYGYTPGFSSFHNSIANGLGSYLQIDDPLGSGYVNAIASTTCYDDGCNETFADYLYVSLSCGGSFDQGYGYNVKTVVASIDWVVANSASSDHYITINGMTYFYSLSVQL